MAIDHVRDYFNYGGERDPMANPAVAPRFLHALDHALSARQCSCSSRAPAPALMTSRKTPSALGAFLFKRGVWLIFIEWCVVATAWSFAPGESSNSMDASVW
jgi:hypothetical protein